MFEGRRIGKKMKMGAALCRTRRTVNETNEDEERREQWGGGRGKKVNSWGQAAGS